MPFPDTLKKEEGKSDESESIILKGTSLLTGFKYPLALNINP